MICALVKDNVVLSIVTVSTDEEYQELSKTYPLVLDITDANPRPIPGWIFNGNALVPGEGMSAIATRRISKLKLLERFTDAELAGIEAFAAQSNAYAYSLRAAMRKQQVAAYIDLNLPQTIAGVNNLVALGLLTAQRAGIILNTPVSEEEKYKGIE